MARLNIARSRVRCSIWSLVRIAQTCFCRSGGLVSPLVWLAKFFAISPDKGAETIVHLASSPAVADTTGQYFYKSAPIAPSSWAQDDEAALLLWQRSAALAGMKE